MVPAVAPKPGVQRGVVDHVIILDGTFSSLDAGQESNAGITFQLLKEKGVSIIFISHHLNPYQPVCYRFVWSFWHQHSWLSGVGY